MCFFKLFFEFVEVDVVGLVVGDLIYFFDFKLLVGVIFVELVKGVDYD